MRRRIATFAGVLLGTASIATVGSLALFSGPDDALPSGLSDPSASAENAGTAPTTTVITVPETTAATTTSTSTTTTTTPPPRVELTVRGGGAAVLAAQIEALYTWMVDPGAALPRIPEGLAAHLDGAREDGFRDLTARIYREELAGGAKVAVALVGDDIVLAVAEGSRWEIVGARLNGFGSGPWYGDPIRHVFVIGTDARPHQSQPDFRADSIHILGANLDEQAGGIVGFPRDTYVAASYGRDKYSSVNVRGSTGEMVRIAEEMSGIEMEGYILTGFAGFKHLVNVFGGVEVNVPFRMSDNSSNAFLDAGLQVLKGGDALAFSRNRHINGGDFTRSRHQGVVIKAGLTGAQAMGIARLPRLLQILSADTWTNLSPAQLLQLGAIAFELDPAAVGNVVLPGSVGTANGASVVRLTSGADRVFEDLADGVITEG